MRDIITGVVLIGIGFAFGGSVFLGDFSPMNIVFDASARSSSSAARCESTRTSKRPERPPRCPIGVGGTCTATTEAFDGADSPTGAPRVGGGGLDRMAWPGLERTRGARSHPYGSPGTAPTGWSWNTAARLRRAPITSRLRRTNGKLRAPRRGCEVRGERCDRGDPTHRVPARARIPRAVSLPGCHSGGVARCAAD